mmetsp:Transcript_84195/g.151948  ORF Transcript_84195/g.151948 Transcript_84195/m.151948 type:complete len:153 (+) Transcript_84195:14-472(+)
MKVFQFLGEFRRSFESLSRKLNGGNREAELTRMLRDLISRYNTDKSKNQMRQMEQELEDVTDLMRDNLSKVMERGERIESLIDKTSQLKNESVSFRANAKKYNDDAWWRDQKGRMLLWICVLAVVVISTWWTMHSRATKLIVDGGADKIAAD